MPRRAFDTSTREAAPHEWLTNMGGSIGYGLGNGLRFEVEGSYRENEGKTQGTLDIAHYITTPRGQIAGRVLLVDDLADSGVTLQAVVENLRSHYPAITELRSAVLWTKGVSAFKPDYSVEHLPTSPWIHQPFEHYDSVRPAALSTRLGF